MIKWYDLYYEDTKNFKKIKPDAKLKVNFFKSIRLETTDYKNALYYNASAVADSINRPLNVLLSGGADSEVIVRVNKDLGISQNIIVFKFEDDLNYRDVTSAQEICKTLNLNLTIIDFNISKFFEQDAESYYLKTFCPRVEILPRLKWHEYFDDPLIFGDGEPYLKRLLSTDYQQKSEWIMMFSEYEFFHYLYTSSINKNIISPWYHFTPEIYGNFLKNQVVLNLINDQYIGKQSTFSSKVNINNQVWPTILPKSKLVGYEGKNQDPGYIPDFMIEFRDQVMINVSNTDVYYNLDTFYERFNEYNNMDPRI